MDNVKGTNTATFVLNQAQTGEPSSNVGIAVNRGDEVNVGIRYNEGLGAWEFGWFFKRCYSFYQRCCKAFC